MSRPIKMAVCADCTEPIGLIPLGGHDGAAWAHVKQVNGEVVALADASHDPRPVARRCDGFDGTIAVHRPDFTATLKPVARIPSDPTPDHQVDTLWNLHWTDHVANEWDENYGTLPIALMRLAALDFAVATDGMFTDDQTNFAAKAAMFLEGTSS